ncbi:MAG: DNA-binding protein [Candidatus Alcyoniella australis]|nr:DNA-binding protein [Candidatus Alcyoniella australis]
MSGISIESTSCRRIIGRLETGDDLRAGIIQQAKLHNVTAGTVTAIGALSRLEVSEYHQDKRRYTYPIKREAAVEVLNLTGNLTLRDEELVLHAHIVASYTDEDELLSGTVHFIGGHVVAGTVYALEFEIQAMDDVLLHRGMHGPTGLTLWDRVERKL